jgi:ABC-type nickel/cobalt efflux system permease component RcnA
MPALDADGDGHVSDAERAAYVAKKVPELVGGLELRVDGRAVPLAVVAADLRVRPGAADLPTLLVTVDCRVPLSDGPVAAGTRFVLKYRDNNYPERMGWREITARAGPGFRVVGSDVPQGERSGGLETYPADPTEAPPQERDAEVHVQATGEAAPATRPASPPSAVKAGESGGRNGGTPQDRFTGLITASDLSAGVVLASLAVAFVLGSFHALSPGHGKTVVAAYLVGSRGTPRHAVLLGLVVTLTHVAGVLFLGLVVLFASAYVLPERLYPWLGFGSGFLIVALGVWQFSRRYALLYLRSRGLDGPAPGGGPYGHVHGAGGHTHELPDRITPGGLVALGVSGGMVPCPSALVVMLASIAMRRVAFGLLLVVTFSVGLAAVLIAIGLLMLYARRQLERLGWQEAGLRLRRLLPLASPVAVAVLGFIIAAQAVRAGGILRAGDGPAAVAGR